MAKSRKQQVRKAKGKAVEKKFFMIAAVVTVLLIILLYFAFLRSM